VKANKTLLLEFMFDIMSDHEITIREFVVAFFKSRIKNKDYRETFIDNVDKDIKGIHVADSRDYHPSLFEFKGDE